MKISSTIIACLISTVLLSQTGNFKIGLGASFEVVEHDFQTSDFNSNITLANQDRTSYGLNLQYGLSDKLILTSGVILSNQEFTKDYYWITIDQEDSFIPTRTNIQMAYIRIPLLIGWNIAANKFNFTPSCGLNFDLLMKSTESSVYADGSERVSDVYKTDLSSPHTYVTFDMFVGYYVKEEISIGIAPYLNHAINILDRENIEKVETNFGGRIAIFYNLK